jgi:mRNA-degrading endonuclease RelE of RelBE toxin-antitoxin system
MVYSLFVHDDAKADLRQLSRANKDATALILAVLEEIQGDQGLLDSLTVHGFGNDRSERFGVSKWLSFWDRGVDLWRLRIWDLEQLGAPYRVVYAYERGKQRYHILGIFHRDFDYNANDPRTKRVKNAYDNL